MPRKTLGTIASRCIALAVVLGAAGATNAARAQDTRSAYPSSPVIGVEDAANHMTVFLIPVAKWSDGTAGPTDSQ